jgi:hypothetical protein
MRMLFLFLVIVVGLAGASYGAARLTAGKVTGPSPKGLGAATTTFEFEGISSLRGKPRGWIIAYPKARGFGPSGAEIYVSPTGGLLGTRPADLASRLQAQREELP